MKKKTKEKIIKSSVAGVLGAAAAAGATYLLSNKKTRKKMKLPQARVHGIFSHRFVGSKIPPKRKTLRIHSFGFAQDFLRRGINSAVKKIGKEGEKEIDKLLSSVQKAERESKSKINRKRKTIEAKKK